MVSVVKNSTALGNSFKIAKTKQKYFFGTCQKIFLSFFTIIFKIFIILRHHISKARPNSCCALHRWDLQILFSVPFAHDSCSQARLTMELFSIHLGLEESLLSSRLEKVKWSVDGMMESLNCPLDNVPNLSAHQTSLMEQEVNSYNRLLQGFLD